MRTLHSAFLTIVLSATLLPVARAAEEEDPSGAVVAKGLPPAAPAAPAMDPNLDRGFILPTAMTQPAGSITYNNYELLLHGVTYGITDRVQASVTALSPITSDMPVFVVGSLKGRLLSTDRFHLAVQGSLTYLDDMRGQVYSGVTSVSAGAFGSFCLREDCSSLFTLSTTYSLASSGGDSSHAQGLVYGASLAHSVTPYFKLLGEVVSGSLWTASGDSTFPHGALVNYGARFHSSRMAADIGFVLPVSSEGPLGGFLLGIPFVSFSYRWS